MENEFGITVAIAPPKGTQMERPKQWSSWVEWIDWQCYRGLGCSAVGDEVVVGFAMSATPLDEAAGFAMQCAAFTPEQARHFARRLIAAADRSEQGG